MAERNLTSLGTNINSLATQLMVMMPTAERTGSESSRSTIQDESKDAEKRGVINGGNDFKRIRRKEGGKKVWMEGGKRLSS